MIRTIAAYITNCKEAQGVFPHEKEGGLIALEKLQALGGSPRKAAARLAAEMESGDCFWDGVQAAEFSVYDAIRHDDQWS